jgi:SagB-type dehydrogenase family enzyme
VLPAYMLSFVRDVILTEESAIGHMVLQLPGRQVTLRQLSPTLREILHLLARTGATEQQLTDWALKAGGTLELAQLKYFLQLCTERCLLQYSVLEHGLPLATAVPLSAKFRFQPASTVPEQTYILSRFAYCRRDEDQLVLESPLSFAQVHLHGWKGAALLAELVKPRKQGPVGAAIPGMAIEVASAVLSLLAGVGMLTCTQEHGRSQEDGNSTLRQWEFHDLLFHARSRLGRHAQPVGGTYRFLGKIEPLPSVKPALSDRVISLEKPDMALLMEQDRSLTRVLEHRRSIRKYGEQSITRRQLSEFLYRSARAKPIHTEDQEYRYCRPYAGAGGIFELELYIAVNRCEGMPTGLYHYYPTAHQLVYVVERNADVAALLQAAEQAAGGGCTAQVLIIIAARFQRVAWQYQSIAYSLILKDVGVLFQTMYLVATAMDLAPCALGTGDSDLFAQAVGTEYCAETSVGEFLLGTPAANALLP